MQNPNIVLGIIESKAKETNYQFKRLYRNFYHVEFYRKAYAEICKKAKSGTADEKKRVGFNLNEIQNLIEAMKTEAYQPQPVRQSLAKNQAGKNKRQKGMPPIHDYLVQEILRSILEAIYEPNFSEMSHGFRPDKSCHTALFQVKTNFTGVKWWVVGNIKGIPENVNNHTLIHILRKKIADEKFLRLVWKFLRAGYFRESESYQTYGGTPSRGILSPLWTNILLNELDSVVEKAINIFRLDEHPESRIPYLLPLKRAEDDKKHPKMVNVRKVKGQPEKRTFIHREQGENDQAMLPAKMVPKKREGLPKRLSQLKRTGQTKSENDGEKSPAEIKQGTTNGHKKTSADTFISNSKKMNYTRYADEFLVGITGSKEDAMAAKEFISAFVSDELDLKLNEEKTSIIHNRKKVRFLGYDLFIEQTGKNKDANTKIGNSSNIVEHRPDGKIKLSIPHDRLRAFMIGNGYVIDTGKGSWKAIHRSDLLNRKPLEILRRTNTEFRSFFQYYKLAFDVREKLLNVHWLWIQSVTKTLAAKYKTKVSKLKKMEMEVNGKKYRRFYRNGTWGVSYTNNHGKVSFATFIEKKEIQSAKRNLNNNPEINVIPGKCRRYERI